MKKLNFGCGESIWEGWDNVDIQNDKRLTKIFDFDKFPYPLKSNTYDYIEANQVLEHLSNPKKVLEELYRICKNNAIIHIEVPHYNSKGAYVDITHKRYFSETAFVNFVNKKTSINKERNFEIVRLTLEPTRFGKIFPKFILGKAGLFFGGIIGKIIVDLKVKKTGHY